MSSLVFGFILLLAVACYGLSLSRARSIAKTERLLSTPHYYAVLALLWCLVPTFIFWLLWLVFEPYIIQHLLLSEVSEHLRTPIFFSTISNVADGILEPIDILQRTLAQKLAYWRSMSNIILGVWLTSLSFIAAFFAYRAISQKLHARKSVEKFVYGGLFLAAAIAILTTLGIVLSVFSEAMRFFQAVPLWDFLTGLHWSPQTAIRDDQVGSSGSFGAVPLFIGTLQIAMIAMIVAIPIGIMSAIWLAEYASHKVRRYVKPILELLAGIPTVVYGFIAALTLGPFIRQIAEYFNYYAASESMLAAGIAMGVMVIPFIASFTEDALSSTPKSLRDSSYGLGATQSETIIQVLLPAALPGIVGGILLAFSRAIGETMIVVMAAGIAANLTVNPLDSVTTITVQIVSLLTGDQEFDSTKTLAAFGLGLVLFVSTLLLNLLALWVVKRYRQYE